MQAPAEFLSAAGGLPSGECRTCGRRVLASDDGDGRLLCVHCETPVRAAALVGEEDLEALGYASLEEAAGCGTGCGSGCAVGPQTSPTWRRPS